jgi:hypothetical protein
MSFDERMQNSEQRDSASAASEERMWLSAFSAGRVPVDSPDLPVRTEIGDEVPHIVHGVAFEELEVCGLTRCPAHAFARHRGTRSEETLAKPGSIVLAADIREVMFPSSSEPTNGDCERLAAPIVARVRSTP